MKKTRECFIIRDVVSNECSSYDSYLVDHSLEATFSVSSIFRDGLAKSGTFATLRRLDSARFVGASSPHFLPNHANSTCLDRVRAENCAITRAGKVVYPS